MATNEENERSRKLRREKDVIKVRGRAGLWCCLPGQKRKKF